MASAGGEALDDCSQRLRRQLAGASAEDAVFDVIDTSDDDRQIAQITRNIDKAKGQVGNSNAMLANIQQEVLNEGLLTADLRAMTSSDMGVVTSESRVVEVEVDVQAAQSTEDKHDDSSQQGEGNPSEAVESQSDNTLVVALAATAGVLVILVAVVLRAHRAHDMQEGAVSTDGTGGTGSAGDGVQRSGDFADTINPMRASAEGGSGNSKGKGGSDELGDGGSDGDEGP